MWRQKPTSQGVQVSRGSGQQQGPSSIGIGRLDGRPSGSGIPVSCVETQEVSRTYIRLTRTKPKEGDGAWNWPASTKIVEE